MSSIVDVVAREILDSRGNPTLEAACCWNRASWDARRALGASTRQREASSCATGISGAMAAKAS